MGNEFRLRPGERTRQFNRFAQDDPSVMEDNRAVGQQQGLVHVVGDKEDGWRMNRTEIAQQLMHRDLGQGVERAERLVGQDQFWLAHKRLRQCHTLLFTAG
ncbi:hypothetical protein SAMN02745172_03440 [Pseudoxanthobacter soli DSM 19599]|uniref:Uncharacterized protein n=1 Tax=Pseudoxanthobacter soli DSM 19599 TaxID=1123029 RepID=A0A1M7ZPJ0_9HYPH|nr:hypothetical protein SAMN02745172_03440 [Pseudoxanthobacter soli DSM 19599]